MINRKEELIKHLSDEYYLFNIYDKDKIGEIIEDVSHLLIKYEIGKLSDPFVFTEREYVVLYKYISELEYEKIMGKDDRYILSYKIYNFNKENYEKNKDLYIFKDTYLLDSESNFCELSESYNPKVEDIERLLNEFKIIKFGKLNNKELEWIVLEENNNELILLSKYLIDDNNLMKYYDEYKMSGYLINKKEYEIDYKNSNICKYLNNDFYNIVFSDEEKERIILDDNNYVNIPDFYCIANNLNTSYLNLLEPCVTDFGISGVYKNNTLPYLIRSESFYALVEVNGMYTIPILNENDDLLIGIRAMITIKK